MHISILSLFTHLPLFLAPSSLESRDHDHAQSSIRLNEITYQDISSLSYLVETVPGLYSNLRTYPDGEIRDMRWVQPLLSTMRIQLSPARANSAFVSSVVLVDLLHLISSPNSSMRKSPQIHFHDIVQNLYELEVLSNLRRGDFEHHDRLPLHVLNLKTILANLPSFIDSSTTQ